MLKFLNAKFLNGWLRKWFCRSEVKPGKILVLWRDVDNNMYGWTVSADNEYRLSVIAKIIDRTKVLKLKRMVGIKKGGDSHNSTISPMPPFTEGP